MGMQMQFTNPDIQAKLEQWATETGRPAEELVEDVMAVYLTISPRCAKRLIPAMMT